MSLGLFLQEYDIYTTLSMYCHLGIVLKIDVVLGQKQFTLVLI